MFRIALICLISFAAVSYATGTDSFSHVREFQIPAAEDIGPDVRIADQTLPLGPPPNPQVGDSWVWWLWSWYPMPPHFEQHVCTVRGMSSRGYVVVKDTEWLVSIDQDDVDAILEHWENSSIGPYPDQGIYEIDSLSFGTPPDELDGDPRIYLMWYDFVISADGFFFFFDEYPEGTYPEYHSNECEVLYLNTQSTGGPSGNYMHGVIAHEFEHLIHWKQDENESSWVDEGMAELAMYFFGNPDNISAFNSNPDNNLTVWDSEWADYIQTYLWSLYFFEQYGGHEAVYALVQEQGNSMAGYDTVLDSFGYTENTEDLFIDWAVANFLDDTTIEDGRFGYTGEDLPTFNTSGSYSSYPVSATKTVNNWAADYYRFHTIPFESMDLTFDGSDDNSYAVRALVLHSSEPTEVLEMTLEAGSQSGTLFVGGLNDPDDHVILVAASVSSSGGQQYTFTASEAMGISPETGPGSPLSISPLSTPFSGSGVFQVTWQGGSGSVPEVSVYDVNGRLLDRLEVSAQGTALWNSGSIGAGVYFVRAVNDSGESVARIIMLR